MSLSIVTSCLTCVKRLWLLSTMLSRMSRDTCCIDASVGLALTKLAIWKGKRKEGGNSERGCSYSRGKKEIYVTNQQTDGKRQIQHLLDEDGREVLPWNYPMIHQFHEACQCVGHDHTTPEWHTQKEMFCTFTHTLTSIMHSHTHIHWQIAFSCCFKVQIFKLIHSKPLWQSTQDSAHCAASPSYSEVRQCYLWSLLK